VVEALVDGIDDAELESSFVGPDSRVKTLLTILVRDFGGQYLPLTRDRTVSGSRPVPPTSHAPAAAPK
jgi:hypothetical protein